MDPLRDAPTTTPTTSPELLPSSDQPPSSAQHIVEETNGKGRTNKLGMGKDKSGWGDLPVGVLHLIFSHVIEFPPPDNCIFQTWRNRSQSYEIALAIEQRIRLCTLRKVSLGWKSAADSHSFWPTYTLLLDPSRPHSSTLADIDSARLTPSTPSFPTLFHRARYTTLHICIPCRLNHPSRLGLYPAVRRRLTYTKKFGYTPTCEKHYNHFCSGCYREYSIESLSPTPPTAGGNRYMRNVTPVVPTNTGLLPCNAKDTDEDRTYRLRNDLICRNCRRISISNELTNLLKECSRNTQTVDGMGVIRGLNNDWINNQYIKEYIEETTSTCVIMANKAVELQWLMNHTRYTELWGTAMELQRNERMMKDRYINHNFNARLVEWPHEKQQRLIKEYELKGEDFEGRESLEDHYEFMDLCKKWNEQYRKRFYNGGESDEDDALVYGEEEEEDEEEELRVSRGELNDKYQTKLQEGCINDWFNDRVRFGFWVSPSDEVLRYQFRALPVPGESSSIHTSVAQLCRHAKHPLSNFINIDYDPIEAEHDSAGLITLNPLDIDEETDPFLSPERLLGKLDGLYEDKLRSKITPPLTELVRKFREWFGNDDIAEQYCERLAVGDIIKKLDDWELWVPRKLVEHIKAVENRRIHDTNSASVSTARAGADITYKQNQGSPKIELVQEENQSPTMAEYGIKEIAFIASLDQGEHDDGNPGISAINTPRRIEDDEVVEGSPKLGKRKSPNEQEDALPEKKVRHSPPPWNSSQAGTGGMPVTPSDRAFIEDDSDSSTKRKRKLPPSPETHHIDRVARAVSPPAPLRYDLNRVKDDTNIGLSMSNGSSMPTTPSPMSGADADLMVDEEEDDAGVSERSETEISSHDTIGTMPITPTPEAEEWTGSLKDEREGNETSTNVKIHVGRTDSSGQKEVVTIVDTTTGHIISLEDDEEESSEEQEEEEMYDTNNEEEEENNASQTAEIDSVIKEYLQKQEKNIPFLPLSPPGLQWNLGEKTNSIVLKVFYEQREVLRTCRCTICERSKAKRAAEGVLQGLIYGGGNWVN
ncbi:uncharacterized protein L199_003649 [Kwoniella botswanensis]|uniref:uncharacterized protein n=1 Tax=Kwoniella botswanensis TaxID=1268659 RepID=UPI00315D2EBE